ncbi:hypothetical protein N9B47_03260, partial [bacterium]|nr:hypothetical protein [bacterium]
FPGSEGKVFRKVLFQFLIDFDRLIFRAGRKKRGGKGKGGGVCEESQKIASFPLAAAGGKSSVVE